MSFTALRNVVVMPAASVATSVTSARPIISAAAVDAVRCGLRRALSRASAPAAPPIRVAGQPRTPDSAGMNGADSIATPMNTSSVPTIRSSSTVDVPCENRPRIRSANPSAVSTAANGVRNRWKRPGGSSAPSRTAAIGGTRVARSAGKKLAIRVTTIPSASETITVRVSSRRPLFGSVNPTASNSEKRPFARPRPRKRPTIEASTPITSASSTTDIRTWRRDAPSVRSVASSRVRCAIVIESELTITNAPTNSAITPNASRK